MSPRSTTLGVRIVALLAVMVRLGFADEAFDKLFSAGNYSEAIKYADEKIPIGDRDASVWAKLGIAHEGQDMTEKALACYMVAIRNDAKNYEAHLGAARINNNLGQNDIGLDMAKKALAIKTTGEASWEYARACLALKSPETKTALEKVVETDKSNAIANKELGNIYYNEKNFEKALPLLKNSYNSQSNGEIAYKLAVAYQKQQNLDSAAHYYKEATRDKKFENKDAGAELSRIYYKLEKFSQAAEEFGKLDKLSLSADDLYKFGHSLSKSGVSKDSVASILELAVTKYGTSVSREALLAREKVGKAKVEKKDFQSALDLFLAISKADPQGKIVQNLAFFIAEAYDGLGDREKAIPMLEKVINDDKNNVEAYARLADLYTKEKMGDKAQQVYEKLLSLQPNNPQVYKSLGEYSLKTRKYEDALKYFQKSFTLEQNSDAAQGMMNAAWELKKYDLAQDAAESALHKDSTLREPQLILARINLNNKNYTAAQQILEKLVKEDKSNKDIWLKLAVCYEQTKNTAKLAEADKTIMSIDKKDVASRQRYAAFALSSNNFKDAFETYKDLASLTPRESSVFKNLQSISLKLGNKDEAITYLKKYLKLMPKDAVAYKDLGNLLYEKKDSTEALSAYREALKIDPAVKGFYKSYVQLVMAQTPPKKPLPKGQKTLSEEIFEALSAAVNSGEADENIYTSLAEIHQDRKNFVAAIDMYQKALQLNPKNNKNLSALASCQQKAGKIEDAIITYEQVTTLNQSSVNELKLLGDLYSKNGKKDQAISAYKKYLEKGSDPQVANNVAEFEFEKKNYKEAIKYYEKVTGSISKNPNYLLHFATAAYQENDLKKASELFKVLTAADPKVAEPFKTLYEIASKDKNQQLAAEYLQKYTSLKPSDTPMILALGNLYYDLKNTDGALEAYKAVFKADPATKGLYKKYLELLNKKGTAEEKIMALNGAVNVGEADVNTYLQLGDLYKQAGNFAKAMPCYEKASQLDAKNTSVLNSLAECQVKTASVSAAILTYEQAIAMNPAANSEYKILGDLYKQDKKTDAAIKNYKKYLEKNSDNGLAKEVGEFAYSQKNFPEAIKYLAMVSGADAEKPSLMKMYADAYYQNKDDAKAYEIYRKLADKTATDADVIQKLYEIAAKTGKSEEYLNYLKKYTAIKPADIQAQRTLGDKLFDKKDSAGALNAYRAVLKTDPQAKGFYKRYAELIMASGAKDEELVAVLTAGIAAGEADVNMYQRLASIYSKQGNHAKAVQMFEKASQLDTKNIALITSLGEAQAQSGNVTTAIMTYEQAIAMNPSANKEYKILGDLYKKDKKNESAIKNYKKYLEKNSDNGLAKEIGEFAYSQKNYAEAIKYLGMVNGTDVENPAFLKMYADAHFQNKDDAKAFDIYKKVTAKNAADTDVFKKLYEIAGKLGANEDGLIYLKKYAALKPTDVEAQRTLGDRLFEKKDSSGALAAYQAVLKADPKAKGFYQKYTELVINSGAKDEDIANVINAGINAGEANVSMYQRLASIYSKQGNHANAVQMYEKASQLDTKNIALISALGEAQSKSGNVSAAIMTYEQAIAMNPSANKEYKVLGDLYKKDKKTESAIKNYKKYLEKNSDNSLAREIGEFAYSQKNYAEAIKYLGMVSGAEAENPSLLKMYADAYSESKDDAKAYEIYKKLGEKTASDADVIQKLYEIAAKTGKNEESLLYLKKLAALKPADVQAQRSLGDKLYEKKDSSGALAAYKAVLKADPKAKGFYKKYAELIMGSSASDEELVSVLTAGISAGEADVNMYQRLASIYSKKGDHAKAVQMFEKASQLDTKNIALISSLGEAQAKSGNVSAAIMTYEQAVAMNPQAEKEYRILGDLYKKDKKNESAIKNYKKYLEKNVDNSLAKEIGEFAYSQKNYAEVIKYLAMVKGQDAENTALLKMLADAYYQSKDDAKAYEIYKKLGDKLTSDPDVFKNLYEIAAKTGKSDESLLYLKKYSSLKPADVEAQRSLGDKLFEKKDNTGALAAYKAVLKVDPQAKGFYKRYAELVMESTAKDEEIISVLTAGIAAGEADVNMYKRLASIYSKQGNHAKAVQMYEKASQIDTKNISLISSLGESQAKSGNISAAIMTYEQAIAMNPSANVEYKILGDLYNRDKKNESAIKNYKKYLEKNSDNGLAKEIGEFAYSQKNYPEAIKYLGMITGAEAENPSLLKMLADAYYQSKNDEKAFEIFKKLSIKTAGDADVFKMLYEIAGKLGSKEDALVYLKKYTALKPSDIEAQRTLGDKLYEKKDSDGALGAYRAVLKSDPKAKGFYKKYAELVMGSPAKDEEIVSVLTAGITAGEADVGMYQRLASIYSKQGDHAKAVQMYEKASQLDTKNIELISSLGEAQAKSGSISAAIMTYEQAVAMNPQANKEYKILGDLYKKDKKIESAIKNYKKYLEKNSDNGLAKEIGEYAYSQKNYGEAIKYLGMVSGADADNTSLLKMYATAYRQVKDDAKAFEIYKKLGDKAPADAEVFENLYQIAASTGKSEEHLLYLKKYSALKPADVEAQRSLGDKLFEKKDNAGALAAYKAVLKADPNARGFYKKYAMLVMNSPAKDEEIVTVLTAGIAAGEADVTMYERLASIYSKQGNNAKAVEMYGKASQLDAKNIDLLSKLAESQAKSADVNGAILTYEQAIAMNPQASKEYKVLGDLYKKNKKDESAIKNYKKYLEKNSDNNLAKEVGEYALKQKNYPEAIKYLSMVSGADATNPELLKLFGEASYQAKDEFRAFQIYKQLGEKTPKDAEVFERLYQIAGKAGTKDEVLIYLKKYTALKPGDVKALLTLGDMLYAKKDNAEALNVYRAVLKADPNAKGFYKKYSELVKSSGAKDEEIISVLKGGIDAGEGDVGMYQHLASIYSKQGNHAKAVQMYEKASQLDTKNVELINALAESQAKSGNVSGAILTYEQAIAMNPQASKEYKVLGDLYKNDKKIESAIKNYKKYLEKNASSNLAFEIGEYAFDKKNYAEAIKYLGMVTGKEASEPQLLKKYGEACYQVKDNQKAYQIFKTLSEKAPADADVMMKLYDIAGMIGSKDEALNYLKKYTGLKPADAERQKELGNILYERKDVSGAIAAYSAALKANPTEKGFYKKYAELVMQNGKDQEIISVLNGAIASGEADVKMYVRLGSIYFSQGNFIKAVQMYESASQLDPRNGKLLISLAESQAKSGNLSSAVLTYEQAVAMNPDADNEYKSLGDLYMQQKKTDAAIKAYKKYLEKSQDNVIAKLVGENALNNKNYTEAVKYLGMVNGADASEKNHLMKFAMACYNAKDEFRAYQLFKQLSNVSPQDPVVYEKLYDISNRAGTKDEVLTYLKRYAELKPSDAKAQINLGNMLYEKKDESGALAAYRAALKADSAVKGFYKKYAELVIKSGSDAEKIVALNGAIAQGDADSKMYMTLADIYNKQNLLDKAISMYEKAAQLDTKNPQLLTSLAECQLKKGSVNEAIITFEQAVTINPRADKEYKQLGDLYLKQKKVDSAIRYYKKYLEKNPTDNEVALVVGEEAFKTKNYQDAVKFLAMVKSAESKKVPFLTMYGDAAFEVKDFPRALIIYKDLALMTPKNADIFKRLYEINIKSGAPEEALNYLKKYTSLKPDDAEAQKDLGNSLYEKKEFVAAFVAYQNALKYNAQIKGFYKKYVELVMKYGKSQDKVPALQGAIAAGEADAKIYSQLGQIYSDAKNYNKAFEMLEKASQMDPRNAEILSQLADCQMNKGDLRGAAMTYEQALAMNPNAVNEYKQLGDLYMQQKKTDAAITSYKKYLDKAPSDYAVAKMVARNYYSAKDFTNAFKYYGLVKNDDTPQYLIEYGLSAISAKENRIAINVLEKLRVIKGSFPSKDIAYKSLAEAYEKSGDQKKAAEVLNEYVRIPGVKDPDASYKRASVYETINASEAVTMYKENLASFPKDYRNYLKLGIYYSRQKSGEQDAIRYLEKVTILSDTIPRVWLELGSLYLRMKRDQDMLKAYRKYLEVAPEDADAIGKIGEILLSRKMVDDAMVFLEMANSLKENDPKIMTLLARGYIMTKRRKEGADLLEKVVKITKGKVDDDLRVVLVDVYIETSQYEKAAEELKALMAVNRDKDVMIKYARVLFELGKINDALSTVMEIKSKDPENMDALMMIGKIKTSQKKYDDAIETYKEILYIDQNYSPALCERANVYLLQGKLQWAQTFYDRALKSDPKNAQVHLGLARLAKQQKDYAAYTDHLEKARKLDPQNKEIQEELRSVRR